MKRYEHLDKAMCHELEKLNKKYDAGAAEMTEQDVERADKLYHALKCAETYYAMIEAEDEEESVDGEGKVRGHSYARYRSPVTGRYISREAWPQHHPDGWSGHYPMEYVDPYWTRR